MKKNDLLKLALVGISSASLFSSQVFAAGSEGACAATSSAPGSAAHGCGAVSDKHKDTIPALTSDGKPNYQSNSSSSQDAPSSPAPVAPGTVAPKAGSTAPATVSPASPQGSTTNGVKTSSNVKYIR